MWTLHYHPSSISLCCFRERVVACGRRLPDGACRACLYYALMASISLQQVKTKTEYNLSELYDEYLGPDDKNCENEMSPFEYIDSNCDY